MLVPYFREIEGNGIVQSLSKAKGNWSSARSVRSTLEWVNERNPHLLLNIQKKLPWQNQGGRRGRRQVSTVLMSWATHTLQWRTTMRRKPATASKSLKFRLSSDWGLQPDPMKLELLVMVNQQVTVNTFSGLVQK